MADNVITELEPDAASLAREFSHMDPAYAADPYPFYKRMRDECPVARSDQLGGFSIVSRYADVNEVLRDYRRFTSIYAGIPQPEQMLLPVPPLDQDPPSHTRYRRILLPFFTPPRAASLDPLARDTARGLVADLRSGDDVYLDYCFPIPSIALAQILGVDASDREQFCEWIELTVDYTGGREGSDRAQQQIFEYLTAQIEQRRAAPKDDLLTFLLTAEVEGETLNDMDRLGISLLLLIAGIDTTANTLANAIWYLAQDQEARRQLVNDPALIPAAVEEFLRVFAPVSVRRTPTEDVELSGCPVAKGEPLLISMTSANRDERQFPDPDSVLFDRERNNHIAFGAGVHLCLGVHIARMELRVGLEEFLAKIPDFELADPSEVEWKTGPIRGPKRFALRF